MLRYLALPGIVPRVRAIFGSGFGWLSYMMALTYQTVKLLPPAHPYCNPDNIGRFGIRHVIAEAANNLKFDRKHIDQVLVFGAMLAGFVILALQFALLVISLVMNVAWAFTPAPFEGMFNTANPQDDIALMMLWQVFGVPGLFCSNAGVCTNLEGGGVVTPFHSGLHALFNFYNLAMLLVGVLILIYYVVVIVGETAQTGTPFGRRFSHIYAPLRLVIAIGLLVPLNYGYNSAQYITMVAARMGSGFATNTWTLFNTTLTGGGAESNPTGHVNDALIARTNTPDLQHLMKFMMIVQACRYSYQMAMEPPDGAPAGSPVTPIEILPYFVDGPRVAQLVNTGAGAIYDEGSAYFLNGDITIRFGHLNVDAYTKEDGHVMPFCGELSFPRVDSSYPMAVAAARAYATAVGQMWDNDNFMHFGERAAHLGIDYEPNQPDIHGGTLGNPGPGNYPDAEWKQQAYANIQTDLNAAIQGAYLAREAPTEGYAITAELLALGWGGAGIWYNRIAQWNSSWIAAVKNVPAPTKLPSPMEQVQSARRGEVASIESENRYSPQVAGQSIRFQYTEEWQIAETLNRVYNYWTEESTLESNDTRSTSNPFKDIISAIFGVEGLFTIRENHDIHPLAQLVAIGKGIIDAAVRNLTLSVGFSAIAGGMEGMLGKGGASSATQGLASMFMAFTMIGLTIGFVLFYILPFMPFMYFFFAVGGWLKSVFEAMVGVPLWALAHLKIDGNGLPGDAAMNGYFLIFEIFVRPILTVFGLLASLAIFTAQVKVLHELFDIVTNNLTGFDGDTTVPGMLYTAGLNAMGFEFKRDPVDEFFFTIIYTIIVYLLATGSFKLIDQIPNEILRWMGTGARAFADRRDDPVSSLTTYATFGGAQISGQVTNILSSGAFGIGKAGGSLVGSLTNRAQNNITGTPPSQTP